MCQLFIFRFFNDDNEEIKTVSDYDDDNEDKMDKVVALNMKKMISTPKDQLKRGQTQDICTVLEQQQLDNLCKKLEKEAKIDYQQFISHLNGTHTSNSDKVLKATFKKLDTNGDNTVTSEELKNVSLHLILYNMFLI